nr:unnamed protein product [Spirometra erinaceieuropaei]
MHEKCQEIRTHLYSTFVNLTKAFDTLNREGLWNIMQKLGCPERFIQMVCQLHYGMMARVTDNGAVSEAFAVTNGMKLGCVLSPILFRLMFSVMLMDAYRDERPGICIAYKMDGQLLKHWRMHFQSRVSTPTVHELLFIDDCALNAISKGACKGAYTSSLPPATTSAWSSTRRKLWLWSNRHPKPLAFHPKST